MNKKQKIVLSIVLIVALVGIFWYVSKIVTNVNPGIDSQNPEQVAKCLAGKEVLMYGSKYCPHCIQQKALFGDAFNLINYIECTENPENCSNLQGVPAWEINGNIYYGTKGLADLAGLAGC